jgi:hypothetical protein
MSELGDPCKPQACAIQNCLKKNGYNEAKCTQCIDTLYECCQKFYEKNGENARSPCCPIPRLLKFKIEQRRQEDLDAKLVN